MEFEPPFGKSTNMNQETGLIEGYDQDQWLNMKNEEGNPQPKLDMKLDENDQRATT